MRLAVQLYKTTTGRACAQASRALCVDTLCLRGGVRAGEVALGRKCVCTESTRGFPLTPPRLHDHVSETLEAAPQRPGMQIGVSHQRGVEPLVYHTNSSPLPTNGPEVSPPQFTGLSVCLSLRPAGSSMFRVNPSEPSPPLVPLRLSRSAPASTALCVPSSSNDRGRLPPCKVPLRPKPCVPLTLTCLSLPSHALLLNKNQRRQVPFLFPM